MKIGLSLSGGAANGAFHHGAINALHDFGFASFDYVAGVSVGAIVGTMANNLEKLDKFYKLIAGNPGSIFDMYFTNPELDFRLGKALLNISEVFNLESLSSNCNLKKIIDFLEVPNHTSQNYGVGLVSLDTGKYHFVEYQSVGLKEFKKCILASASMLPIFPTVDRIKLNDKAITNCADGGLRVISPIVDLIRMTERYEHNDSLFIEINCRNHQPDKSPTKNNMLQYLLAADSIKSAQMFSADDSGLLLEADLKYNIINIQPSDNDFIPPKLDFSKKSMDYMSKLGYNIAIKQLKKWEQSQKYN